MLQLSHGYGQEQSKAPILHMLILTFLWCRPLWFQARQVAKLG